MSSYYVHCVRKCSSVSTVPCSQWGHRLFSLGSQVCLCLPTSMATHTHTLTRTHAHTHPTHTHSQVCLCLPTSMARLCSLSLYFVNVVLRFLSFSLFLSLSPSLSLSHPPSLPCY